MEVLNFPHSASRKDRNLEERTDKDLCPGILAYLYEGGLAVFLVPLLILNLSDPIIRLFEGDLNTREVLSLGKVLVIDSGDATANVDRKPVHVAAREPRRCIS